MCTMLSTTHISTHAITVGCTHVHHIVHYTHINTCYYSWLYPCAPCCPLHTYQHMLLLLAVPMYTILSTTHISTHAIIVGCTLVQHVVHYTHINTCYYCCLYPCAPCCPLHTYQHMLLRLAVLMCTMLSTTHISTHAITVGCTHVHHVVHYTHINTCYYCWLYPCAPCCPLHTYQHMLLLLAVPMCTMLSTRHISTHAIIAGCTHVHHVVHYTHINTCYYCWLYPCTPCCPLHTYQHVLLLLAVPMYTMLSTTHISTHAITVGCTHPCAPCCPLHTYQHMLLLLAVPMCTMLSTTHISTHAIIVDCTHVHHVVYYKHINTCYYCWLYPCAPCCPLHTSTHAITVGCSHVHHVVHYTYINTCYYCWLYSCAPCCPLHTYQHVLLLLAVPMCTMLSTTHISTHAITAAVPMCTILSTTHISTHAITVGCTHVHHVVHYTHINTCYYCWLYSCAPCCPLHTCYYCWLFPCAPCCPLHTYQHMLLLLAIPMCTMLSTTHISTHAIIVGCTHVYHVVHYTHINTCYYCWLYPFTPCCPLHTYQHVLLLLAVPMSTMLSTTHISTHAITVGCTHVHHVVHYTHINTCYYCWLYPCAPCCPLQTYQHMLLLLAVPMCTMLSTTHISTHAITVSCTHVHHVVHYTHINTCYNC